MINTTTLQDGAGPKAESPQKGFAERSFRFVADGRRYLADRVVGFR